MQTNNHHLIKKFDTENFLVFYCEVLLRCAVQHQEKIQDATYCNIQDAIRMCQLARCN